MANYNYHPRKPVADRFWPKVNKDGPIVRVKLGRCWVWTRSTGRFGYGRFTLPPGGARNWEEAHRVSWRLAYGDIAADRMVLHRCDNPPCVNPEHLFLGDSVVNARDRSVKGRTASKAGVNNGRHILTESMVAKLRAKYKSGETAKRLSTVFGVSPSAVWRVATGRAWRHVAP